MAEDGPVEAIETFLKQNPPDQIDIPDSVGGAEAVHAVQKQYGDAGLECTEDQAQEIVDQARDAKG